MEVGLKLSVEVDVIDAEDEKLMLEEGVSDAEWDEEAVPDREGLALGVCVSEIDPVGLSLLETLAVAEAVSVPEGVVEAV